MVLQDCWGLGVGLTTPPHKTIIVTKKKEKEGGGGGESPPRAVTPRKNMNNNDCDGDFVPWTKHLTVEAFGGACSSGTSVMTYQST
jgi:hypothetical protein